MSKYEWWYDGSEFYFELLSSQSITLRFVRLQKFDDGTVELMFSSGVTRKFCSYEDVELWLRDDEFDRLEDLVEDYRDTGLNAPDELALLIENSRDVPLQAMTVRIPRIKGELS